MRFWLPIFIVLVTFSMAPAKPIEGRVLQTPNYRGVIFTPEMVANFHSDPVFVQHQKVTYWTPSIVLIEKAEAAFSKAVNEANRKIPTGGFHQQAYYTPKYYSRDREQPVPADAYTFNFYDWDPQEIKTVWFRQYIGVTVAGKRALLINLFADDIEDVPVKKTQWIEMCPHLPNLFYLPETGELCDYPF